MSWFSVKWKIGALPLATRSNDQALAFIEIKLQLGRVNRAFHFRSVVFI